jgi:2-methylcitrate dehydratase PrpD
MAEAQEANTIEDCLDALRRSLEPKGERLTRDFATFVADAPSGPWPDGVVKNAKTVIFDTFGVALAASGRAVGQTITRYAAEAGPAPAVATIIGGNMRVSPEMAALANGTLANALDFNESSHITTHVLPAILSLAERDRRSGKDVLDAFVIGFEAGTRFAECFDSARAGQRGPTYRGWWHVGLAGPIAAAMAASRMLGLSRGQTATAIGIASSSCGGFRRNMGSMAKPLHSGNAARAGIQGALLAQKGFTADPDILEAPLGFMEAVCRPDESDLFAVARLGNPFVLAQGMRIKPYPSCARAHPGLDAILLLQRQTNFSDGDVELIEADLEPFSLLRPNPSDEDEAGFSGAFLFAAAVVDRALGLDQISERKIRDPRVIALMHRFKYVPGKKIVVHLRDGRVLTAPTVAPGGPRIRRLTVEADILAKYRACAEPVLGRDAAGDLLARLQRLEEQPTIEDIMAIAARRVA